jgi:hypothetical protein
VREPLQVAVGDEVRIFHEYLRGQPRGGEPGTVSDVRRTLFDVEYGKYYFTATFRLDTGMKNEKDSRTYVKTVEQVERDSRYEDAEKALRERHIDIRFGADFTLEQLERLVEVLEEFDEPEA